MLKITTVTELKNSLYWFNIRLDQAEERISKLKSFQSIQGINKEKRKKKTMKKGEESLRDLRNAGKGINKHIMGIPEWKEKDKGVENVFK